MCSSAYCVKSNCRSWTIHSNHALKMMQHVWEGKWCSMLSSALTCWIVPSPEATLCSRSPHHQHSPVESLHLLKQHCVHTLLTITISTHLLNRSISWTNTVFTLYSPSPSALTCWIVPSPEPTLCSRSTHHQHSPVESLHLLKQHCVHAPHTISISTHLLNRSISWTNTVFMLSSYTTGNFLVALSMS